MASKRSVRIVFAILVLLSGSLLTQAYVTAAPEENDSERPDRVDVLTHETLQTQSNLSYGERRQLVEPRSNITVVTNYDGPLVAFSPNGTLLHFTNRYKSYWDVDPSPVGKTTVLYSATVDLEQSECPVQTSCTRNVVARTNLTTGETERLFVRYNAGIKDNEWHDVDRIGPSKLLVADMARDLVYTVDVTTERIEWAWDPQADFNITSGGSTALVHSKGWPNDWTHVNDVEYLDRGLVMVSLRNQDQIVFVDPEQGLRPNMTLGADENYSVMYEQHNADYIPRENGGPAVVLADSQNNRIVEFQRNGTGWTQSWAWSDRQMLWPRDADRLPNGNTLVTDTHSHRVFDVNRTGGIDWSVRFDGSYEPYEAERLGTGDESTGGPAASAAGLRNRGDTAERDTPVHSPGNEASGISGVLYDVIKSILPNKLLNGLLFVVPSWLSVTQLIPLAVCCAVVPSWLFAEVWWYQNALGLRLRSPVVLSEEE